jgi:predicted nucleic acid-binding protein
MTSRLSRLECRVKPMRDKQAALLGYYDSFFVRTPFLLAEITEAVVDRATELRAAHNFKTPDALHLATALEEHADLFLTGDANLTRCPGLKIELI